MTLLYTFDDGSPGNGQGGGQPATATGTTTINVAPIDDFTVTQDDAVRTAEDTPVVIDVLANDSDVDSELSVIGIDGGPIAVGETVAVAHGSATLNEDGTLTFTPAPDFNGETSFAYVLDTFATATVTVTVDPAEDPTVVSGDLHAVVAEGDIVTLTTADLTATDPDVTDDLLVYTVTGVSHGLYAERRGDRQLHAGRPRGRPRPFPARRRRGRRQHRAVAQGRRRRRGTVDRCGGRGRSARQRRAGGAGGYWAATRTRRSPARRSRSMSTTVRMSSPTAWWAKTAVRCTAAS